MSDSGAKAVDPGRKMLESAYLGQWLVDRGTIMVGDLEDALALCRARNLPIGELAVRKGLIDESASQRILDAQRTRDCSWGELAVMLDFLNPSQIDELLEEQTQRHLSVGEALVRVGALSADALEARTREFHTQRANFTVPPTVEPNRVLERSPLGKAIVEKFPRVMHRMSSGAISCHNDNAAVVGWECHARLSYGGGSRLQVALAADNGLGAAMAQHILGLEPEEVDEEMVQETLSETLNVVAGLAKEALPSGDAAQLGLPVAGALDRAELVYEFSTPFGRAQISFAHIDDAAETAD